MHRWNPILVAAALGMLLATLVGFVTPISVKLWRSAFETLPSEELETLRLVHNKVLNSYVQEKDADELMVEAIRGMVQSLDQYSSYIDAEDVADFIGDHLEGTYQGIGILMLPGQVPLQVHCPLPGGPAERAGLQIGDRILSVDGEDLSEVTAEDILGRARELLLGPAGTSVLLSVRRGEDEPFEVEVRRGNVPQRKVRWTHLFPGEERIGYLWVEGFQSRTTNELAEDLIWLRELAGGDLRGLILDLRQNPGGLLDEAVEFANLFLAQGEIVRLVRRDREAAEVHNADPRACLEPTLPLVVLIDGITASAAEVVTGALKDHGRARVVGMRSFGKGVVQSIYDWPRLDFRLKLTTAQYLTPAGHSIDRNLHPEREGGIAPDVEVPLEDQDYHFVQRRLGALEVPRRYRAEAHALSRELGLEIREPLTPEEDAQLAAGLAELRQMIGDDPAPAPEPTPTPEPTDEEQPR